MRLEADEAEMKRVEEEKATAEIKRIEEETAAEEE